MPRISHFNKLFCIFCISVFTFLACKKVQYSEQEYAQDEKFFSRNYYETTINLPVDRQSKNDIIDTIINQIRISDLQSRFAKSIVSKYGYPAWGFSIILRNENGCKTIITPVVEKDQTIQIAIVSYQVDKRHTKFKVINRNANIKNIAKYGDTQGSKFTQDSYKGLFNAFDKGIRQNAHAFSDPVAVSSNISFETKVYSYCWSYSIMYPDGSLAVSNTQCSYRIIIRPDFPSTLPEEWQIPQPADSGGGGNTEYTNQEIIDSLTGYPCAQGILSEVPELTDFTKEILQDVFGVNEDVNMKFSAGTDLASNIDGDTRCGGGSYIFDCNVRINPNVLANSTKEYILATMIHEALHGYIKFQKTRLNIDTFKARYPLYYPIDPGESDHKVMAGNQANNFVSKMAAALMAYNSNLTLSAATALAWGGLQGTDRWKELGSDTTSIKDINAAGRNPASGASPYGFTRCP